MIATPKGAPGIPAPILGGRRPARPPERMWGGAGSGAPCAICGERIAPEQLEYELEYRGVGERRGRARFHVHVRCCPTPELEPTGLRLIASKA